MEPRDDRTADQDFRNITVATPRVAGPQTEPYAGAPPTPREQDRLMAATTGGAPGAAVPGGGRRRRRRGPGGYGGAG